MKKQDFTDYYQYSWNVITPPPSSVTLHLINIPLIICLSILIGISLQRFFTPYFSGADLQISWLLPVFFSLVIFTTLHLIFVHIIQIRGPRIHPHHLNRYGFTLPHNKQVSLEKLKRDQLKSILNRHLLANKSSWNSIDTSAPLILELPLNRSNHSLKLKFNHEVDRQKVLRSLSHYHNIV